MTNMLNKIRKTSERGQAIIIIAFSLVGLIAIVGLMVDGGMTLIEYARLKRGIDSASVAAASQFRKGFVGADLEKAGREFLKLNQSDATVSIYTCNYPGTNWDATLCSPVGQPQRKLVRITAKRHVDFAFMRIVGITGTDLEASSVGEAASIDMVLALDTSSSMAYETTGDVLDPNYATNCILNNTDCVDPDRSDPASPGHPYGDDPKICNTLNGAGECEPMATVKDAAIALVDQLFFPYDRVALVAFTGQETNGSATRKPTQVPTGVSFMDNDTNGVANTEIQAAINSLKSSNPRIAKADHTAPHTKVLVFSMTRLMGITSGSLVPLQILILSSATQHPAAPAISAAPCGRPVTNLPMHDRIFLGCDRADRRTSQRRSPR